MIESRGFEGAGDLEVNVIEIVDVALGGQTNESNVLERVDQAISYYTGASGTNREFVSRVRRINTALSADFVRCVEATTRQEIGVFSYVRTFSNPRLFSLEVRFNPDPTNPNDPGYNITSASFFPSDETLNCQEVPLNQPILDRRRAFTCERLETNSIVVQLSTDRDVSGF
ncbi:MAG: hypothetical protein AAFQ13_12710, partial [Pseudomonadota bacterium]